MKYLKVPVSIEHQEGGYGDWKDGGPAYMPGSYKCEIIKFWDIPEFKNKNVPWGEGGTEDKAIENLIQEVRSKNKIIINPIVKERTFVPDFP